MYIRDRGARHGARGTMGGKTTRRHGMAIAPVPTIREPPRIRKVYLPLVIVSIPTFRRPLLRLLIASVSRLFTFESIKRT